MDIHFVTYRGNKGKTIKNELPKYVESRSREPSPFYNCSKCPIRNSKWYAFKKIFVGKLEYPVRHNQANSSGVPLLFFTFQKIFYRKSWMERAHPHNEKSTFRKKYLLFCDHHTAADTLQFKVNQVCFLCCPGPLHFLTLLLDFDIHSFFGPGDFGVSPLALQRFYNRSGRLIPRHCVV